MVSLWVTDINHLSRAKTSTWTIRGTNRPLSKPYFPLSITPRTLFILWSPRSLPEFYPVKVRLYVGGVWVWGVLFSTVVVLHKKRKKEMSAWQSQRTQYVCSTSPNVDWTYIDPNQEVIPLPPFTTRQAAFVTSLCFSSWKRSILGTHACIMGIDRVLDWIRFILSILF